MGLHNYWPQQYYSSWNFKEGMFDTSLNKRRPWYSLPSNELVDTNYSNPWGHGLARSITAEHILGLRQYELTNQTQNVMAVVLDKRFIKTTGNGNRDRFMASISAAYDYYPYGMLMPGRTTADTTTHCMTVMKEFKSSAPFPKAADMSKAVATLGGTFTPPAGGGLMGGTVVYGKSGGLKLDLTVVPGDAIDVRTDVSWLTGFGVTVTVSETTASGVKRTLGSKTVSFPGLVTLPVRPSVNKITLTVDNMSSFVTVSPTGIFSIAGVSYDSLAYWSQWSPVTICDKNVDKYPFGFNGQMKSNDVAGIGNFNTAELWEYNTRTGRRLNPDPKPNVSMSVYSTFSGNPIRFSDVRGDSVDVAKLYERDANGNLKNPENVKGFELFASTDEGREYIMDHAQKGFKLKGEFVCDLNIEATEEGALSKLGVDLIYRNASVPEGAGATTSSSTENGLRHRDGARLKTTFTFPNDRTTRYWDRGVQMTIYTAGRVSHESLLHGKLHEARYFLNYNIFNDADHSDRIFNNSYYSQHALSVMKQSLIKLQQMSDIKPLNISTLQLMIDIGRGANLREKYGFKSEQDFCDFKDGVK